MIDPIITTFGPIQLRWYGVLVATSGLAGFTLVTKRAAKYGISKDLIGDLALVVIASAILGARLFYIIRFWETDFAGHPFVDVFKVWKGGLVFQGGFIVATIAVIAYLLYKRVSITAVGDLFAPGLPLAHAIGRLGCLINGCCFGFSPYEGPCAVHYPGANYGIFPAQAVESLGNLLLCLCLLLIEKLQWGAGKRFLLYMAGYTILRICVEPLRGDYPDTQRWCGMTPGQYHALWQLPLIAIIFAAITWYRRKHPDSHSNTSSATPSRSHNSHPTP